MSHSGRPSPIQPPFIDNRTQNMAQTERALSYPSPTFAGGPDQTPGPQLPSIHSIPHLASGFVDGRRNVQLPPMQVPHTDTASPSRTTATRSIPVSQLLSTNPPSPPRQQARVPAQQTSYGAPPSSHGVPPMEYRSQPPSYPQAPQHCLDQAPMAFRQPPQGYQTEQFPRAQYPHPQVPVHPDQSTPRHYSPAISGYSSPSYTHSEASPRSSLGPSNHPALAQKPRVSQVPPLNYNLGIRQQPIAARACGFGERDRRVVDPPPIIELKITDRSGMPEQDPTAMLALNCTLLSPDGHDDETELPPAHPDMPSTRRLMGTLVASSYQAKDENGIAGTFFVFPDLSCRSPGKYRLKFKLLRVDPMNTTLGAVHVASIVTDIFSVYTAKDFPGMRASSGLLKALRRQGLNVGIKKGSEARKGKGKAKKEASSSGGSSSEGEDESDDGSEPRDHTSSSGVSPKTKARKKGKRRKQNA
ncbi:hypothetical protein M409DRAFT_63324 [Zasmidium cellare ATCC 36951]|uniref:Velvet domain-containing protein n=1 Tax=Zasmidium cellare ATCC 36951 TaxID=1080233 RepID=A0A6A6CX38_ZASCE|nr:uncharacterized protein M409DRAFT_63324 [Zasmidium cellare ATCC 36951]KAF2171714.1 hypothetical protein M409DRAFT_63324 [Zasmidium cellare ATCC 36951]